jgi:hypothetical protein
MMRTIEVLLVIVIITGASIIASFFAFLPQPQQVSPINLRRLALTTLEMLDSDHDLSQTVFTAINDRSWGQLQAALSASLPPNIVYNLTVYDVSSGGTQLYNIVNSISNAQSLGISSDVATDLVASSNATFNWTPEKIGAHGAGGTLYILNCSDSNGWWITGYTSQTLANDLYNLLSPYFQATIMVQSTDQLSQILHGTNITSSPYENVTSAVIINTNGEAVPIPSSYNTTGYDSGNGSYAYYSFLLGKATAQYNWTWVSIVGYPLYYVSNTNYFPNNQNGFGIYGMMAVGASGLNSFFEGLNNETYNYNNVWITNDSSPLPNGDPALANVLLSSEALGYCDTYGIYPSPHQTATRALPVSILARYNLSVKSYILQQVDSWLPGAFYTHAGSGAFLALGLARTPDVRLTALGLLCGFKPRLGPSQYGASGTSRLVVLQLGQVGGV